MCRDREAGGGGEREGERRLEIQELQFQYKHRMQSEFLPAKGKSSMCSVQTLTG